jgi:hypothetical protein
MMPDYTIRTKALLACGAIGCPLFVLAFLIEGAARSDYNPLRHPISSLSIGDTGWMQVANFIITGILLLVFAIGLRRVFQSSMGMVWGHLLIGLVAIGLIGAGIFTTDPVYGYPQNTPLILAQHSVHGHLHDTFSILVFLCLPAACFVLRRRFVATGERGWATYSAVTGIAMFMTFVFAGMGFKQFLGFVDFAGVFQRLSITIGWTWMTLLALHLLRTPAREGACKIIKA